MSIMNGFLFIDKDSGWTSRDVCNKVSSLLCRSKVGHIGTLDPFATGLLILLVGAATKTSFLFEDNNKEYIATLKLGKKTSTGDKEGEVIKQEDVKPFSEKQIKEVLNSFIGEYSQIPPMTSAIHVNGVKLYELAHQGKEVEREPRKVYVNSYELISYENDTIIFKCNVSKGTYIRTLGEDIAARLHTVGYLEELRRTKIDQYDLSNAINVNEVSEGKLISIEEVLPYEVIELSGPIIGKVKNGVTLTLNNVKSKDYILVKDSGDRQIIAIYQFIGHNKYKCIRGLWN